MLNTANNNFDTRQMEKINLAGKSEVKWDALIEIAINAHKQVPCNLRPAVAKAIVQRCPFDEKVLHFKEATGFESSIKTIPISTPAVPIAPVPAAVARPTPHLVPPVPRSEPVLLSNKRLADLEEQFEIEQGGQRTYPRKKATKR
jgi:hypothetical protein